MDTSMQKLQRKGSKKEIGFDSYALKNKKQGLDYEEDELGLLG